MGVYLSADALLNYLRSQPEIADAAVAVVPDDRLDSVFAVRLVLRSPLTVATLRERVRAESGRSYVPRDIVIAQKLEMPQPQD